MLSTETNERLTRVGPGTEMGELLRRYWMPVSTSAELAGENVRGVRVLGESLALFRSADRLGLVDQRCPHRGASLAMGIPSEGCLECPYHGWTFDSAGGCVRQPAESADSTFHTKVRVQSYPVQELGGLIWAYMGPGEPPLLPRYDLFVAPGFRRWIGVSDIPCNFLQVMENSFDPVHREYLHGRYSNYVLERKGQPAATKVEHHTKLGFDVVDYGIVKRRLVEGQDESEDDWRVGHPVIWPTLLSVGNEHRPSFQIRVPMDDVRTLHFWYMCEELGEDATPDDDVIPAYEIAPFDEHGEFVVDTVCGQDMMAWITQGAIADRTREALGRSDEGLIVYRKELLRHLDVVAAGEDPPGVMRDGANDCISIPRERSARYVAGGFRREGGGDGVVFARRGRRLG
jgi:5,5'-dehydrodivanillate O-demethylase oxygenase subunit